MKKVFVVFGIIIALIVVGIFGFGLYIRYSTPNSYIVRRENTFAYQTNYECSGYASAYVLRSYGLKAEGHELYNRFLKNEDGTVSPTKLVSNLEEMHYKAKLRTGDIEMLKYQVSRGRPIIVFVKVNSESDDLHYLPVVGYDSSHIYFAESLIYEANEIKEEDEEDYFYNRSVSIEEFEIMWQTDIWPNSYITISLN